MTDGHVDFLVKKTFEFEAILIVKIWPKKQRIFKCGGGGGGAFKYIFS